MVGRLLASTQTQGVIKLDGVILTKHPEERASRKVPNTYSVTAPSDTAEIA